MIKLGYVSWSNIAFSKKTVEKIENEMLYG